jgi:hypothetical protein
MTYLQSEAISTEFSMSETAPSPLERVGVRPKNIKTA